jgi:hypothetical protein
MAAAAAAVVLDASAALEVLLPDSATRFSLAADLFEKIGTNRLVAHVPLIFFNEVAAGCARAYAVDARSASMRWRSSRSWAPCHSS